MATERGRFDPQSVARRLQEARGDRSQREVGRALGYLQPHISRYERGEVPGSYRYLSGLASVYGVDVNWVLTGRRASRAGEAGAAIDPSVLDGVRALVRDVLDGAVPGTTRPALELEVVKRSYPSDLDGTWDAVVVEVPVLIASMVREVAGGRAGKVVGDQAGNAGAPAPPSAPLNRGSGPESRWSGLLEEVRDAAARRDMEAARRSVLNAAAVLEEGAETAVELERARFLLLWAWLLAAAAAERDPVHSRSVGISLFRLARLARKAGRPGEAEPLYAAALAAAGEAGDAETVARCHAGLGTVYFGQGEFERARGKYLELLEGALRLGDSKLLLYAYLDLSAYYHEHERDYTKAADYALAGLEVARRGGDLEHAGRFLNELGLNAMELGDAAAARERFAEALRLGAETGSPLVTTIGSINLGELQLRSGDVEGAVDLLQDGRASAARAGLAWAECQAEILLARADLARAREGAALDRLERVLERCEAHALTHERRLARALEREIQQGMLGRLEELSA